MVIMSRSAQVTFGVGRKEEGGRVREMGGGQREKDRNTPITEIFSRLP